MQCTAQKENSLSLSLSYITGVILKKMKSAKKKHHWCEFALKNELERTENI